MKTRLHIDLRYMFCFVLVTTILATASVGALAQQKLVLFVEPNAQLADFHQELAAEFTKETGIEVEVIVSGGGYPEQVQVYIASGAQIDVTQLWAEGAAPLMAAGAYRDLTEYIERDPDVSISDFVPPRVTSFTWHGELLGLPMNANIYLGLYNRNAVLEAGLQPPDELGDGWDWNRLRGYARALSRDSNSDGAYDRYGLSMVPSMMRGGSVIIEQAGAHVFDAYANPTKVTLESDEGLAAVEFLHSLYVEDGTATWQGPGYWRQGNSALQLVAAPFDLSFNRDAALSFDWGVMPLPRGPVHDGTIMLGVGYQITKSSQNPDLAWRLIKFLATNTENVMRMVNFTGRMPGYIPALREYETYVVDTFGVPTARYFAERIISPHNFPGPILPRFGEVTRAFDSHIRSMINGEISPRETVTQLGHVLTPLLTVE